MGAKLGDCSSYLCIRYGGEEEFFGGWGYSSSTSIFSSSSGAEKNVFMNALVFSSFDVASIADPTSHFPKFSVGTQALLPLDGDPDVYRCVVHIVLSFTDCRKSSQWVLFAFSIIVPYEFLAVLWASSSGLLHWAYEILPNFHTSIHFCDSSFDHHLFVNRDGLVFGTVDSIVSVIASISVLSLL